MNAQQASISRDNLNSLPSKPSLYLPRLRFKDQYWFKSLKWHLYKRFIGSPSWRTHYLFDRYVRQLKPGDLAIDCGANIGHFTRILANQGARVHAFEPDPFTFSILQENTKDLKNVVLHNAAVGTSNSVVKLYRKENFENNPLEASISSSLFEGKLNVDPEHSIDIEQIDFGAFLNSLDQEVTILKIDIEGAEIPLLENLVEHDSLRNCTRVFVETHEDRIPELADRTANLRKLSQSREYSNKLFLDWN